MSNILKLTIESPLTGVIPYVVSGPTHIGRADDIDWKTNRAIPEIFKDLETHLQFKDAIVSRNHAGIIPVHEGQYSIIDLGSANGTYLNCKRLPSNVLSVLEEGSQIGIGSYRLFVGERKVSAPESLVQNENIALLVGNPGWNLRGVENDLERIGKLLKERGYRGGIRQVCGSDATKQRVTHELEEIARIAPQGSHFFFQYSGHGDTSGLALANGSFSPGELYGLLRQIRAKKAVILDCCHAGIFRQSGEGQFCDVSPNTLLLTAAAENRLAYEGPVSNGERMGYFTAELAKYLESHPERLNLYTFKDFIAQRLPDYHIKLSEQRPDVTGAAYTVCSFAALKLDAKKIA